jgi:S1-C subfamily serine protease
MLVKDEAKTPTDTIRLAQSAASRMSVTLLKVAENIEQGWDRDTQARVIRSVAKQLQAVLLLVTAMSAQNAPSTNKEGRLDIPTISRKANGAVVSIIMSDRNGHPITQGSGFLISKDGHVVTNYHVIREGVSAIVKLPNGASFHVDGVLASDKNRDVAIIKAHGFEFRTLSLGDSGRLQVGEEVVAIGNPLSLESTVSNGIVSAFRTDQNEGGKFCADHRAYIPRQQRRSIVQYGRESGRHYDFSYQRRRELELCHSH